MKDVKEEHLLFYLSVMQRLICIIFGICTWYYLGGHVVGGMNHHRTGEVFVQVIYIFAHSGEQK